MYEKEELLRILDGKTDAEKKEFLEKNFGLSWDRPEGPCKVWCAKVFTYCNAYDLECRINFFLFLVNIFGYLWHICFEEEDTIYLGTVSPCGYKQTILYYSVTFED